MASRTQSFNSRQKMNRSTFEIFHYRDGNIREVALHHHDFYEIYFFLAGNVSYNVESRNYMLTPGDILLISPNELHQPIFGPEQQNYERYVIWLSKNYLDRYDLPGMEVSRCFDTAAPGHTNLLRPDGVTRELINYLLILLKQESESDAFGAELYAMGCMAQLLVIINRLVERGVTGEEHRENSDSVVYRVLGYINEHYNEDLSLDFLANQFFISKYHLSREFNRLVGTSVYRYIIQKRLVMAKQMISSGMPTSEVYQHCGFGDYSNFYRAFKSEYQISPREFIENLRQSDIAKESIRIRRPE